MPDPSIPADSPQRESADEGSGRRPVGAPPSRDELLADFGRAVGRWLAARDAEARPDTTN